MMQAEQIREAFWRAFRGQVNIMTPDLIRRGPLSNNFCYELAEGQGMSGRTIYGVTVVARSGEHFPDQSQCFGSLWSAETYIDDITMESPSK